MKTTIALFRGINVGGHNKLPMRELVKWMQALGLQDVKTYIQSGNAVFRTDVADPTALSTRISDSIEASHGFRPQVLLLAIDGLRHAIEANPFPQAETDPKALHLYFLASTPSEPDLDALEQMRGERERFQLQETVFYLHAPDGIGRSKLAERVERALGVPVTARNWRSASKILALAEEVDHGGA